MIGIFLSTFILCFAIGLGVVGLFMLAKYMGEHQWPDSVALITIVLFVSIIFGGITAVIIKLGGG